MTDLPESLFANPVWHALHSTHDRFAISNGQACRYPADVAPFIAVAEPTAAALQDARAMLHAGESVWMVGDGFPQIPDLTVEEVLPCLQMVLPADIFLPEPTMELLLLTEADAPDMVALTALTFPGFFRIRTCEMGPFYGVRRNGELIAMGGERLHIHNYPEITAVCVHPVHRGEGLASEIIGQIVRDHRSRGQISWLHVGAANERAIQLYLRLGFRIVRSITATRLIAGG